MRSEEEMFTSPVLESESGSPLRALPRARDPTLCPKKLHYGSGRVAPRRSPRLASFVTRHGTIAARGARQHGCALGPQGYAPPKPLSTTRYHHPRRRWPEQPPWPS